MNLLMPQNHPLRRWLATKTGKRQVQAHVQRLREDPKFRAHMQQEWKTAIDYFARHENYPFLWANNPLEIEEWILKLEACAAHIRKDEIPSLHETLSRITMIAKASWEIRARRRPLALPRARRTSKRAPSP